MGQGQEVHARKLIHAFVQAVSTWCIITTTSSS